MTGVQTCALPLCDRFSFGNFATERMVKNVGLFDLGGVPQMKIGHCLAMTGILVMVIFAFRPAAAAEELSVLIVDGQNNHDWKVKIGRASGRESV